MEYSYCNKMFTPGQKNRMRAALLSSVGGRNNVWTSSNHTATGLNTTPSLCAVNIRVERDIVCGGDDVQFFDESYNNITSWNWTFPNGIISIMAGTFIDSVRYTYHCFHVHMSPFSCTHVTVFNFMYNSAHPSMDRVTFPLQSAVLQLATEVDQSCPPVPPHSTLPATTSPDTALFTVTTT